MAENTSPVATAPALPLAGIRVLDFGHAVMGPSCGLILADLGAEVIRIEPAPGGDSTRRLKGMGIGFFGYFNRNKKSVALDLKTEEGLAIARRMLAGVDVLVENFGPGAMDRLGLGYEAAAAINPRLVYASLKGFLPGPYEHRMALDEVVQMMSGLAYMTGPPGRPLRAGTSVIDIAGGMFAVIGIQAALRVREATGRGQRVETALYETAVFLMGQHLAYAALAKAPVPPMPERVSAWAIYEPFAVQGGVQLFVGITTDAQWQRFCVETGRADLGANPALRTNNDRVAARPWLLAELCAVFAALTLDEACALCERTRLPFAPIRRPEELLTDRHLTETGFLLPTPLGPDAEGALPRLPLVMDGARTELRHLPPPLGQDSRAVLRELGIDDATAEALIARGIVTAG